MKERKLYEGSAGESIDDALPIMIAKAKELSEDVFLRWNGATLRISEKDDISELLKEYSEQLHGFTLLTMEKQGDLVTKKQLTEKVTNMLTNFLMK